MPTQTMMAPCFTGTFTCRDEQPTRSQNFTQLLTQLITRGLHYRTPPHLTHIKKIFGDRYFVSETRRRWTGGQNACHFPRKRRYPNALRALAMHILISDLPPTLCDPYPKRRQVASASVRTHPHAAIGQRCFSVRLLGIIAQ